MDDRVMWCPDQLGQFSVKSAYIKARKELSIEELPVELMSPIWKMIWAANVIPKVKYFIWRFIRGILPTIGNLLKKRLNVEGSCQTCGGGFESIFHAMFECIFSNRVWWICCKWIHEIFQDWFMEGDILERVFIKAAQAKEVEIFCTILWLLWHNKNKVVHEQICQTPDGIVRKAKDILEGIVGEPIHEERTRRELDIQVWQTPTNNSMKLNTDASFDARIGVAGFGVAVRDENGEVQQQGWIIFRVHFMQR